MSPDFLPYGRQEISEDDIAAVVATLREPFITQGPEVARFEDAVASYLGATHAVAFSHGTAALHGASFAAGFGPGDEVVVPPITFAASANCVLYQGAAVRFADISADTWNLAPASVARSVGPDTAGAIAVSYAGLPVDVAALRDVLGERTLIEDASHALGARRDGLPVGGPDGADITVFSLHPVKTLTTGEGGLAVTENADLADRLRMFRTHGIVKDPATVGPDEGAWYYEMRALGFNYRITDFQCALGRSQLGRLDVWVERRNEVASRYRELLAAAPGIRLPPEPRSTSDRHAYHLFVVHLSGGAPVRKRVFETMHERGIGVQVHYIPIYRFPYYRQRWACDPGDYPVSEDFYAGAMSLPMYPALTDDDVRRVCDELVEAHAAAA